MAEDDRGERLADEIDVKAPYWTSAAVNARLADTFAPQDRADAAVLLADLAPAPDCSEDANVASCRLMLDAIRVSGGDLVKLQLWVEAGRADPRDLIGAAEYPGELRVGESARENDLQRYLAWVSGSRQQ